MKVKVGSASAPSSEMGPLVAKRNVLRVKKSVEDDIAPGAKVIVRVVPPINDWAKIHDEFEDSASSRMAGTSAGIKGGWMTP